MMPVQTRIFLCTAPVDMRLGFDRLAQAAREQLGQDPLDGSLYLFANRGATRLKVIWFERHGCCVLYKRAHRAVFELPRSASGEPGLRLDAKALATVLAGVPRPPREKRTTSAK
jgi:transposase